MSVHIIDSNSESDEEMSNTSPDIADGNCNNCPVTINYVNKYIIANNEFLVLLYYPYQNC
jgi:hypothetical protein